MGSIVNPMGNLLRGLVAVQQMDLATERAKVDREALARLIENDRHERAVRDLQLRMQIAAGTEPVQNGTVERSTTMRRFAPAGPAVSTPTVRPGAPLETVEDIIGAMSQPPSPAGRTPELHAADKDRWRNRFQPPAAPQPKMLGPEGMPEVIATAGDWLSTPSVTELIRGRMPVKPDRVVSYGGVSGYVPSPQERDDRAVRRAGEIADAQNRSTLERIRETGRIQNENAVSRYRSMREFTTPMRTPIGMLNLLPNEMGGAASMLNLISPDYKLVTDHTTGTPSFVGVDPTTRKPLTITAPEWEGSARPRARRQTQASRSTVAEDIAGELLTQANGDADRAAALAVERAKTDSMTKVNLAGIQSRLKRAKAGTQKDALDDLLAKVLQDSAQGGGTTIEHATANLKQHYQDDPRFTPGMRLRIQSRLSRMKEQEGGANPFAGRKQSPSVIPSSGASNTVRVQLPDGRTGTIPRANLDAAVKAGAKVL